MEDEPLWADCQSQIPKRRQIYMETDFLENWYYYLKKDKNQLSLFDDKNFYSREDVEILSGKLYSYLKRNHISSEDVVIISMNRSAKILVSAVGILKAGAVYLIVDNSSASKRTEFIKENSKAEIVIDDILFEKIEREEPYLDGYEEADKHDGAFIVYTSGSNGDPKGILHERGNIDLGFSSFAHILEGDKEKSRVALFCPLQFIAASLLFNICINCGAAVYIAESNIVKNIPALIKTIIKNKINEAFFTPDLFMMVDKILPEGLKYVYVGGATANGVYSNKRTVYNVYVSSESGYAMGIRKIDKVSYPTPIANANNGYLSIENGEFIANNYYTRGYLDETLNNGVFENGKYYTGDLGREKDGLLYFCGRKNEMIKINGNRIEPQEIENVFKSVFGVSCVVKAVNDNSLALFYVSKKDLDVKEVNKKLGEYLPSYVFISYLQRMDSFPFTKTGKIDKNVLTVSSGKGCEYIAPKTKLEKKFAKAIKKQLKVKKVSMTDDFFDLGGDSLSIISIISSMGMEDFNSKYFYEGRTIRNILDLYAADKSQDDELKSEIEGRQHLIPLEAPAVNFFNAWNVSKDDIIMWTTCNFIVKKTINFNRFAKVLNSYMEESSLFNMRIVLNEQGAPCVKYSPESFEKIQIQTMSETEAQSYILSRNKPRDLLAELPYSFALVKTEKRNYFLMRVHHAVLDGEGLVLLVKNIMKAYFGLPYTANNFFAYLKENHQNIICEKNIQMVQEIENRAKSKKWNNTIEDEGGDALFVNAYADTGVKLSDLNAFLKKKKLSRGALLCGAMALAKAQINKHPDVMATFVVNNRIGVKNHSGVRCIPTIMFLELNKAMSHQEFIELLKREYNDAMRNAELCAMPCEYALSGWSCNDLNDGFSQAERVSFLLGMLPRENIFPALNKKVRLHQFYFYNQGKTLHTWVYVGRGTMSQKLQEDFHHSTIEALKRIIAEDETLLKDYLT